MGAEATGAPLPIYTVAFILSLVFSAYPHHPLKTRMSYMPTLRQVVLFPSVPIAFWLGLLLSHTKLVAASRALGL
jgi:hypothetical protein